MKSKLLSLLSSTICTCAFSQVVITAADFNPSVGEVLYLTSDSTIDQSIVVTPPGPGQTWDFTLLNNQDVDTLAFIDPSSAPAASNFSAATHVLSTLADGDTSYLFLRKSANDLVSVGLFFDLSDANNDILIKLNPPLKVINFPSQVGSGTNISYYKFRLQFSGAEVGVTQFDSVRITNSGKRLITPDADGILTTPEATYNVLRVETISLDTSKIEVKSGPFWMPFQTDYDTSYTYDFWSPGISYPVVSLNFDHGTQEVFSAQWLTNNPLGLRKVHTASFDFDFYPNPSSGLVKFNLTEDGELIIYDQLGRKVHESKLDEGFNSLNLGKLSAGVYQVKVVGKATGKVSTRKLIINK